MGLALENIGQRDGRSAHIAVFGSSLVELPQVYRAAADRYDLIEVDIGLLPAPRRVEDVADAQRTSELSLDRATASSWRRKRSASCRIRSIALSYSSGVWAL